MQTSTATINERIVQTAARLIAGQIRDLPKNQDEYPTDADIVSLDSPVVPHLLQMFLATLISSKRKQEALGQAIVQASRPHSIIAPLQFALAVALHHEFRSESLLYFFSFYENSLYFRRKAVFWNVSILFMLHICLTWILIALLAHLLLFYAN